VIDFVRRWNQKTEIAVDRLVTWVGLSRGKYYEWRERYGKVNEHNGWIPRDAWLAPWEREAIVPSSSAPAILQMARPGSLASAFGSRLTSGLVSGLSRAG